RQTRLEIVAHPLGLRQVDDADGPLQARLAQTARRLAEVPQAQEELRGAGAVEQRLVAVPQRRTDALPLRGAAPLGRGGDRPGERAEADQQGLPRVPLARELPDVDLARLAHLRRPRIAYVRVVRP